MKFLYLCTVCVRDSLFHILCHELFLNIDRSLLILNIATAFGDGSGDRTGHPYIPAEARQLRLGHAVKLITPQGRLAVGRVR